MVESRQIRLDYHMIQIISLYFLVLKNEVWNKKENWREEEGKSMI